MKKKMPLWGAPVLLLASAACTVVAATGKETVVGPSVTSADPETTPALTNAEIDRQNQWVAQIIKNGKTFKPSMTGQDLVAHYQLVARCLKEIEMLKPGMTRQDLQTSFRPAGGLYDRTLRGYSHKAFPYLKINVSFQVTRDGNNQTEEKATDKIEKVSKPYLEDPNSE